MKTPTLKNLGVLLCIKDDKELSVKEFRNSIEENYKVDDYANFLINKLWTSHYHGQNGSIYDMAAELKAQTVHAPLNCKLCKSPDHVQNPCLEFKEWTENKGNKIVLLVLLS